MVIDSFTFLKHALTGRLMEICERNREERRHTYKPEHIIQPSITEEERRTAEKKLHPENPKPVIEETPAGTQAPTKLPPPDEVGQNGSESEKENDAQKKEHRNNQSQKSQPAESQTSESNGKSDMATRESRVVNMSNEEYKKPIKSDYAQKLSNMSTAEIYDNYNPGPSNPDGTVNFECHCVGHLVASPCGHQFRRAITCQKKAGDEGMERGECGEEFMDFMRCAIETNCFRAIENDPVSNGNNAAENQK